MNSARTLAGGLLGLIVAAGIGCGFLRLLGPIPGRYRLATALLGGVAVIDWAVTLVLFLGGGAGAIEFLGLAALIIGISLLLASWRTLRVVLARDLATRAGRWFAALIVAVAAINLLIAIAPSTKIDELHYHMLIPLRVLQDGGLHLYRQPFEAAIFPQTAFQLGLTLEHAAGFPEAGNVVSWGLGIALVLLVAGVTGDLTGNPTAGWMTGAISAVGLYPAVWHVASGPQALGDLATVFACLLALLPDFHAGEWKPPTKLVLICLAAYVAASTKISNLPVDAAVTIVGIHRTRRSLGSWRTLGIASVVWGVFYGPILVWTTAQCGSPFGLATAALFHSHYFGPETLAKLDFARSVGPSGLWTHLSWLAPSFSAGVVAAFAIVAIAAARRRGLFIVVAGLVCGQILLIEWLLPHEFRFLGGLEYVVLVLAAWEFWPSSPGAWLARNGWVVFAAFCLPWVAVQLYYARPFLRVDTGIETRASFLEQYVAFADDFRVLNRILPADAVLYIVTTRLPSYYAPRPVIFTLEDLRGRRPLYRFVVGEGSPSPQHALACAEVVYKNDDAVVETYRTPGRAPQHSELRVERCTMQAAALQDRRNNLTAQ